MRSPVTAYGTLEARSSRRQGDTHHRRLPESVPPPAQIEAMISFLHHLEDHSIKIGTRCQSPDQACPIARRIWRAAPAPGRHGRHARHRAPPSPSGRTISGAFPNGFGQGQRYSPVSSTMRALSPSPHQNAGHFRPIPMRNNSVPAACTTRTPMDSQTSNSQASSRSQE
jgi:hypothetical protein